MALADVGERSFEGQLRTEPGGKESTDIRLVEPEIGAIGKGRKGTKWADVVEKVKGEWRISSSVLEMAG